MSRVERVKTLIVPGFGREERGAYPLSFKRVNCLREGLPPLLRRTEMRQISPILFGVSLSLVGVGSARAEDEVIAGGGAGDRALQSGPMELQKKGPKVVEGTKKGDIKKAQGATPSKIKANKTHAALKLVVVDKKKGPLEGISISVTGSKDKKKLYAAPTDSTGYTELLVPAGQDYEIVYLSLGFSETAATLPIPNKPNQNVRLTLRYTRILPKRTVAGAESGIVLGGITFDTGKATIRSESFSQLDKVVEYMAHKPGARVEISGHTDSVGNKAANKALSLRRAKACVAYLVKKGIDKSRLSAVGYGDERAVASNATPEGREKNRRIEAREL